MERWGILLAFGSQRGARHLACVDLDAWEMGRAEDAALTFNDP